MICRFEPKEKKLKKLVFAFSNYYHTKPTSQFKLARQNGDFGGFAGEFQALSAEYIWSRGSWRHL